jgi:hypothetical protein
VKFGQSMKPIYLKKKTKFWGLDATTSNS